MGQALGQLWLPWLIYEKKEEIKKWVERRISRVLDSIKDLKLRTAVSTLMRGQFFGTLYLSASDDFRDYMDIATIVAATIVAGREALLPLLEPKLTEGIDEAYQKGVDPYVYGAQVANSLIEETPDVPKKDDKKKDDKKKGNGNKILLVLLGLVFLSQKK